MTPNGDSRRRRGIVSISLGIGAGWADYQLGDLYHKSKIGGERMSAQRSDGILEQEMHGAGMEIPKEETYNKLGGRWRELKLNL